MRLLVCLIVAAALTMLTTGLGGKLPTGSKAFADWAGRVKVDSFAASSRHDHFLEVPWEGGHLRLSLFAGSSGLGRADVLSVYVATPGGAYDYDAAADRFSFRHEYDFMPSAGAFDSWIDGYRRSWGNDAVAAIALPGTFGSGGEVWLHQDRRAVGVMSAAIDELKRITGARRINLAGVSAAGPVVAGLAASRNDVASVTIASAPFDLGLELSDRRLPRLYTSPPQPIDAMRFTGAIAHSGARVVLVADRQDEIVSFEHSLRFKRAIESAGGRAELEAAQGSGEQHHFLVDWTMGRMMMIERERRAAAEGAGGG